MRDYYIYGFRLFSNIELKNISSFCNQPYNGILRLNFIRKELGESHWIIKLEENDGKYILNIGDHIIYHICPINNCITVYSSNETLVESTIINLPFAVFAITQNSLLLHASVLVCKNTLIPICASKGTGKTTLTAAMSKFLPFFSDDTLYINLNNGNFATYQGSTTMKMFCDSASALTLSAVSDKVNIQSKGYYYPTLVTESQLKKDDNSLCKLFFLFRENRQNILIEEIKSQHSKNMYLHANICGAEVLGFEYCKRIIHSQLYKKMMLEISFYKLYIPDGLARLPDIAKKTAKLMNDMT